LVQSPRDRAKILIKRLPRLDPNFFYLHVVFPPA
jgi:hypothetical protein